MADIAMLVAEEYERRVKDSRKRGEEDMEMFSCVAILSKRLEGSSTWIKMKLRKVDDEEDKVEILAPKSQFSVAATNCFFSA
ncbi:uncharacterized protein LOC111366496 [Olea europaea var. sylvestris]|uniref:uncharacterized protein LOC111366496 n=1 Tax=Olea europaea var. sylvestris TaxID=158386 RepID=UPI000C1D570C|nr:uncharacterized protein LOC111366496 [Olea europaea var. sylvestris]